MATPLVPGGWTIENVFALPDDGNRHELVDGTLLVSPPPVTDHVMAQRRLARLLDPAAPPSLIVEHGGLGVRMGASFVIPDLVVVRAEALERSAPLVDAADVLLAVEVVSPASRTTDLIRKWRAYAAAGLPDYWIVDQSRRQLTVLSLEPGRTEYTVLDEVLAGRTYRATRPFVVDVDPGEICR